MIPDPCRALRLRMMEDPARAGRDPHAAACPACRKALSETRSVLAALGSLPEEDPPPAIRARVMREIPKPGGGIPKLLWLAVPAAGILALLAPFMLRSRPVPAPTVPAAPPATVPASEPTRTAVPPAAPLPVPIPEPLAVPDPKPTPETPPDPPPETPPDPPPAAPPGPDPEKPPESVPTPETPPVPVEPGPALAMRSDLDSLRLAAPLQGPPVSAASLAGNVVLVEFWSHSCPCSLRSLSEVPAFERKMRGKPFRMVAVEKTAATAGDARHALRSSEIECSVFTEGAYPGVQEQDLPCAVLFGPEGREIFMGEPEKARAEAERAVAETPRIYLGPEPYSRLRDLASRVETGKAPGRAVQALRRKAEGGEAPERLEALRALSAVSRHVQGRLEQIGYDRGRDPDRALADLRDLARDFSGDEIGERLAEQEKRDAADPGLPKLRKALKELAALEKRFGSLAPCKPHRQQGHLRAEAGCAGCRKTHADALASMRRALAEIRLSCPGTWAAERAAGLEESW